MILKLFVKPGIHSKFLFFDCLFKHLRNYKNIFLTKPPGQEIQYKKILNKYFLKQSMTVDEKILFLKNHDL